MAPRISARTVSSAGDWDGGTYGSNAGGSGGGATGRVWVAMRGLMRGNGYETQNLQRSVQTRGPFQCRPASRFQTGSAKNSCAFGYRGVVSPRLNAGPAGVPPDLN